MLSVGQKKTKTFRESCNATITKVLNTSGANYKLILYMYTCMYGGECPHGYGVVVREFELQSCYNVHFRTNTLEKGMNLLFSDLWVK